MKKKCLVSLLGRKLFRPPSYMGTHSTNDVSPSDPEVVVAIPRVSSLGALVDDVKENLKRNNESSDLTIRVAG